MIIIQVKWVSRIIAPRTIIMTGMKTIRYVDTTKAGNNTNVTDYTNTNTNNYNSNDGNRTCRSSFKTNT